MTHREKDRYWRVVSECLIAFHEYSKKDAVHRVSSYRLDVEGAELDVHSDIFYHNEPYDVACDIADEYLPLESRFGEYERILEGKWH